VASVEGAGPPRIGLVVSKAVGNSVIRHRAARRIRGAVTPLVATLPPGTLVVVRALPGADTDPALGTSVADGVAAGLVRAGSAG
jgi:ribonuclease P protein component